MPSEPNTASVDIVFDRSTVYRLYAPVETEPNLIVKIAPGQLVVHREEEHPLYSRMTDRRVFRAALETYNAVRPRSLPAEVAVKWARGKIGVDRLRYEAMVYQDYMAKIQGTAVPRFYGFYSGSVERVEVGCLLLEWCAEDPKAECDQDEYDRRQMLAICRLHGARIVHGNLVDARNFVQDAKGNVRIVDFANAQLHRCEGQYPIGHWIDGVPRGCKELYEMEMFIGRRCGIPKSRYG